MLTRMQAIRTAEKLHAMLKNTHAELAGNLLVVYTLAKRNGGEVRITPQEIVDATGGKLQMSRAENDDIVLTAIPDPEMPEVQILTGDELRDEAIRRGELVGSGNGILIGDEPDVEILPRDTDQAAIEGASVLPPAPSTVVGDATGPHA